MNKPLAGLNVVVVEDDPDSGELLAMGLEAKGATARLATSGAAALRELQSRVPDCVLCDLTLPDGSGLEWLATFRAVPGAALLPAIATSGHGSESDRAASLAAGFEKHMVKPVSLIDLSTAIAILTSRSGPLALKAMLARLAGVTGCRYTSLLRFEKDALVSVWTFDQSAQATDAFPLQLPMEASYCSLVKQSNAVVAIENAREDARTTRHPAKDSLASYVGAPVFYADGLMFGTLCSYDAAPRIIDDNAKAAVVKAAREVESVIREAS